MRRAILDAGYSLEAIEVVAEVSPDIDIENALDYLAVCAVEILITRCLPYYLCRGYGTLVIKHVRCSKPNNGKETLINHNNNKPNNGKKTIIMQSSINRDLKKAYVSTLALNNRGSFSNGNCNSYSCGGQLSHDYRGSQSK